MDAFLEYAKVPVTIQSYAKYQSYARATPPPPPSYQKYTRRAQRCADTADTTSTNLEEVKRLKSNNDGTFTLDGNFYPLKTFVREEIHLGKLLKAFQDMRREKKMKQ